MHGEETNHNNQATTRTLLTARHLLLLKLHMISEIALICRSRWSEAIYLNPENELGVLLKVVAFRILITPDICPQMSAIGQGAEFKDRSYSGSNGRNYTKGASNFVKFNGSLREVIFNCELFQDMHRGEGKAQKNHWSEEQERRV